VRVAFVPGGRARPSPKALRHARGSGRRGGPGLSPAAPVLRFCLEPGRVKAVRQHLELTGQPPSWPGSTRQVRPRLIATTNHPLTSRAFKGGREYRLQLTGSSTIFANLPTKGAVRLQ